MEKKDFFRSIRLLNKKENCEKNPQNHNKKIRKFVVVQNDYAGTLAQLNI